MGGNAARTSGVMMSVGEVPAHVHLLSPGHTGPSVAPSGGRLGALSAAGTSSFFSEAGTRRLT